MKINKSLSIATILAIAPAAASAATVYSPNGHLALNYGQNAGEFQLVHVDKSVATNIIKIINTGIETDYGNFKITEDTKVTAGNPVKVKYDMIAGKRSQCTNEYIEYTFTSSTSIDRDLKLVCRLYNDGLTFRYEMDNLPGISITNELTTYVIDEGKNRWMQGYKLDYEMQFPKSTTGVSESRHWNYPALIENGNNVWALISEAGIESNHSASSLYNTHEPQLFKIQPDVNQLKAEGNWHSPWRVVIAGNLNEVVESTLVNDVSPESQVKDTKWIKPGVASWIYWAYNHGSKDYQIVKKYIDMAATMHLPYVLIDWEWDVMANGGNLNDAIKYADSLGIKVLLWYNSSTSWASEDAAGPLFRLNTPENREKEYSWLESIGVAGVKIDFFAGDTQPTMEYCIDLLKDAAKHHLLVNFHGATIPRGWQRTYPNLMSTEGVYGAEWYNYSATFTNEAACHNATLPFTRNVVGPMDYTPCAFSDSQNPHSTSNAHELALTVLFESGIQHLADSPESYLSQPEQIISFFGQLPTAWDETKFLSGYPGENVVLARRKGSKWYIAGINGTDNNATLSFSTAFIKGGKHTVTTISDDTKNPWIIKTQKQKLDKITNIDCQGRGGFVMVVE
jgi:hypothetical protein